MHTRQGLIPCLFSAGLPAYSWETVETVDVRLGAIDEVLEASHNQAAVLASEIDEADATCTGLAEIDDVFLVARMPYSDASVADVVPVAASVDGSVNQDSFDLIGTCQVDAECFLASMAVVFVKNCERGFTETAERVPEGLYDVRCLTYGFAHGADIGIAVARPGEDDLSDCCVLAKRNGLAFFELDCHGGLLGESGSAKGRVSQNDEYTNK
jgi:hypothetical protein